MEEWKNINGFEDDYMVSSYGRVKSKDRVIVIFNRKHSREHERKLKGKILSPLVDSQGYLSVCLGRESKRYLVHKLVYEAFNGEIIEGMQVNHIDEDKSNNVPSNLNLMTPQNNVNWGTANERRRNKQGFKVYKYTLDDELVATYNSLRIASIENEIDKTSIKRHCLNGKEYKGYKWSFEPL